MVGFARKTWIYVAPILNHYRLKKACLLCEHKAINVDAFKRQFIYCTLQIKQIESTI